jgi:hypothetical protein
MQIPRAEALRRREEKATDFIAGDVEKGGRSDPALACVIAESGGWARASHYGCEDRPLWNVLPLKVEE